MAELTKEQQKKYLKFLDDYKQYVGLSDWNILLCTTTKNDSSCMAEAEPNIYEKRINITLMDSFLSASEKNQTNILFHELLHARVCIKEKLVEEHSDIEEEHMVNDIVRGFEEHAGLEFD